MCVFVFEREGREKEMKRGGGGGGKENGKKREGKGSRR